jgi:hypothetical protein
MMDELSFESLMQDIIPISHEAGPHDSEFAQTTTQKPDIHHYSSRQEVIEALCIGSFKFHTKQGKSIQKAYSWKTNAFVFIQWKIQNHKNGKII